MADNKIAENTTTDNKNLPVVQSKKQGFFARLFYNLFHKKGKSVEKMMDENQKQINETVNPKSALEGQKTVVVPGEKIFSQENPVDINTMEVLKAEKTKQGKVDDELGFLRFSQDIIDLQHGLQEGRINPESLSDEKIKELNGVYAVQIKELNRHIDDYKKYLGVPNEVENFARPVAQNNMEPAVAMAGGYGNVAMNSQDVSNVQNTPVAPVQENNNQQIVSNEQQVPQQPVNVEQQANNQEQVSNEQPVNNQQPVSSEQPVNNEQVVNNEQSVSHAKRLKISNLSISADNSQTLASSQPQFNHESEEQKVEIELNDKQPNNVNPIQSENVEIKQEDFKEEVK